MIRIVKREFYRGKILEVIHKEHLIHTDNLNVTTTSVTIACVGDLILNKCSFSAVYVSTLGMYYITIFELIQMLLKF